MALTTTIKQKYLKATGKIKEQWPIKVRIYREVDEDQYLLTKETRGRSVKDEDSDEVKLEIMNSSLETTEVPYRYFTNRKDGVDELEIVRHTRTSFSPLRLSIDCDEDDGEVEKVYSIEQMKKTALNDFEQKTNVVESEDEHWIHDKRIQALIIFMGAGLFFVMLGIGYSRVITEPVLNKLNQLESLKGLLPLAAAKGRLKR